MKVFLCVEVICQHEKEVLSFEKPAPDLPQGIVWHKGMEYCDSDVFLDNQLRTVEHVRVGMNDVCVYFNDITVIRCEHARADFASAGWSEVDEFR
jgi:hypothetical protein